MAMTEIEKSFLNLKKQLMDSPLRNKVMDIPAVNVHTFLNRILEEMDILIEKCTIPLNVVLMGEVKSGKSTLLNALIGAKVSPVNVAEATASIIEVYHSTTKEGKIIREKNDDIIGTPDEIYALLEKHHGDLEFFKDVVEIKLGFPIPNLKKLHIVDTPGLATVREQNAKKTEDYIQQCDVILWIFSAHHLGQADIEEKFEEIEGYGKPIIPIINRVDEVNGDPSRMVLYLEDRLDLYDVKKVFPISAKNAYDGITTNNLSLVKDSGYLDLLSYLEKEIEQDDKIHEESLKSSMNALILKELTIHKHFVETIEELVEKMENRKKEIFYFNNKIKEDLSSELKNWFQFNFLLDEENLIKEQIKSLKLFSSKEDKKHIEELFRKELSEEKVKQKISAKYKYINTQFQKEWQDALTVIQKKIEEDINEFFLNSNDKLLASIENLTKEVPVGQEQIKDGVGKGMAIAGAYGTSVAAYTAWMGPYAASVSIGSALGAILPPVLITGAAIGAVVKIINFRNHKKEFMRNVDEAINMIKNNIEFSILPNIMKEIEYENNNITNHIYSQYCQSLANGYTEEGLREIKTSVKKYITKLEVTNTVNSVV
ncbi:dynamin family protein [Bacillus kexueae]|uniref:dynamin family protein n=1 Tax=Aeribacillus kexueae TaxID=2078952 RepID=UPI001FAE7631|nr:dynamin family protein [Bacillus kexueae]